MTKCKVCGKDYKKITSSHVGTHSLTMKEYEALPDTPEVKETKEETPKKEEPKEDTPTSLEDDDLEDAEEDPEEEPTTEKEKTPEMAPEKTPAPAPEKTPEKKEAEKPLINCATCGKPILRGQPVIHQDGKAYHGYASCHHAAK